MAQLAAALSLAARATVRTLPTTFTVEQQRMVDDPSGRIGTTEAWVGTGQTVQGVLRRLPAAQQAAYQQQQHDVTHEVLAEGDPYSGAKPGDQFVTDGRTFYLDLIGRHQGLTVYVVKETPSGA